MARIKKIKIPVGSEDLKSLDDVISSLNKYFDDIMSLHFENATQEQVFINYYDGIQDILLKQRKYKVDNEQPLSNNKVVENHAQAQVDFLTDYLMGEKPKFSSKNLDKLSVDKVNMFECFLNDCGFYTEQREVVKDMFKLGVGVSYQNIDKSIVEEKIDKDGKKIYKYRDGYEKMYDAPFEVSHLDPTMNFVVYSTYVGEEPLFAINIVNLESPAVPNEFPYKLLGSYRLTIYTKEGAFVSNAEKRIDNNTQIVSYVPLNIDQKSFTYYVRPLPMLPIVEKTYNKERMGIIELNKCLFDLINLIDSNGGDAIYDNVNQVFVFENVSIDDEVTLDDLIRSGAIQVSSTGAGEGSNGKVYTIEVKYNQEDINVLKQDVKNSAYEIAGVPLATANTSSGITGTAQKTGGGWENAEIKMNGRIVGMQKSDYSILKCLIEVCKIVLEGEFTNVNSNLIDITYKLSMNDNIMSKCQSASYLYDMKMPLELILKITRLSNDPSSDAKKWQDRIDELDKKEFEKQLASAKVERVNAQQSSEEYSKQKKEEQEIASKENGINKKGKIDMKSDN